MGLTAAQEKYATAQQQQQFYFVNENTAAHGAFRQFTAAILSAMHE